MIDRNDLRQLEKAMTRSVFRGAFWAVILGGIFLSVLGTLLWMWVMARRVGLV